MLFLQFRKLDCHKNYEDNIKTEERKKKLHMDKQMLINIYNIR